MWLIKTITDQTMTAPTAVKGELSARDGTAVSGSGEHKELELCYPYGVVSVPPAGESAVVLPLSDGEVGLGVLSRAVGLDEGELMLYSKGGASIVLKNDGRVIINGQEYGNG